MAKPYHHNAAYHSSGRNRQPPSPAHHGRGYRQTTPPYQSGNEDTIYEDVDHNLRRKGYGTTSSPPHVLPAKIIGPGMTIDSTDGEGEVGMRDISLSSPLLAHPTGTLLRDVPCQLSDGTETEVHYVTGQYTKLVVLILFFSLLPLGLCFFAFLPFCLKCKWTKDINHIDPVTRVSVGRFRRGNIDAPQSINYHRPVQREGGGSRRAVRRQPTKIPQQIIFGRDPVELPDQSTTVVQRRVGYGNLLGAIIGLFICIFLPVGGWVLLPLATLSCFCMKCLKDTEHLHRRTGNVVGVYYRCQS